MNRMRSVACVVALGVSLVVLSPGAGEASPITTDSDPITLGFDSEILSNDYEFDFYTFRISFQQIFSSFSLTVDDHVVALEGLDELFDTGEFAGLPGYECVEMGLDDSSPQCVFFEVSPGPEEDFPTSENEDFAGPILIGLSYSIFGFPVCEEDECVPEDPVDIGEILDFSLFSSFFNTSLDRFTLAHAPHGTTQFVDVGLAHCDGNDIDACIASIPEPGSMLLISTAISGIVFRQVRRRRRGSRES